jgi:hypothetical protein
MTKRLAEQMYFTYNVVFKDLDTTVSIISTNKEKADNKLKGIIKEWYPISYDDATYQLKEIRELE